MYSVVRTVYSINIIHQTTLILAKYGTLEY